MILNKLESKAALGLFRMNRNARTSEDRPGPLPEWAAQTYTSERIKRPSDQMALLLLSQSTCIHLDLQSMHGFV